MDDNGYKQDADAPQMIPFDEILSDGHFNCRGTLRKSDWDYLVPLIKQYGLFSPITVQPWTDPKNPKIRFRIVQGHCRERACRELGWPDIPAFVRDMDDDTAFRANVLENMARKDLNIQQEAKVVESWLKRGKTQEYIAEELKKSARWVKVRVGYLTLPQDIQAELIVNKFSDQALLSLIKQITPTRQYKMLRMMKEKQEGVNQGIEMAAYELSESFDALQNERRHRRAAEIVLLKNKIYDAFGPNMATRVLAWAAGSINSKDLHDDLEKIAKEEGVDWYRPRDMRDVPQRDDI